MIKIYLRCYNMNSNKLRFSGVPYGSLYSEINRLRKRDGLEDIGGLHFALKLHDHVLVEPNLRICEALDNLKAPTAQKVASAQVSCQL
jgi:hypothetical protein